VTATSTVEAVESARSWRQRQGADRATWSPDLEDAYRALAPAVLGYFRSHHVDQPEDLVGEVFVSVARNFRQFRGDADDFRGWVFAIAHRRRVDHTRRWRVRRRVVTADPPEYGRTDDRSDLDVDLLAALDELTPSQREVVVLRFVADLSLEEVARIVHRRVGAVKALQARALAQLAGRLGEDESAGQTAQASGTAR
jgi:RNA polymerase sigma-70 factor (ECF subfamily)